MYWSKHVSIDLPFQVGLRQRAWHRDVRHTRVGTLAKQEMIRLAIGFGGKRWRPGELIVLEGVLIRRCVLLIVTSGVAIAAC